MIVDLSFALTGVHPIPADHGYALYAAISRRLPSLHQSNGFGIHPIAGRQIGKRQLELQSWSRLTLRVTENEIVSLLPLVAQSLVVGRGRARVGAAAVHALRPVRTLRSRLVTVKISGISAKEINEQNFAHSVQKQLDQLEISHAAKLTVGKRRTARIKQQEIVGYELTVEGLLAEESIKLQEAGVGGRRMMGCGVFNPCKPLDSSL